MTDGSGVAKLRPVVPGTYTVRVTVAGSCQATRTAVVQSGQQTDVAVWLCETGDALAALDAPDADVVAVLGVRLPDGSGGTHCVPDDVVRGALGFIAIGDNAMALGAPAPACHGNAWTLTSDRAPGASHTATDFPWSDDLGDIYVAPLPPHVLRVPTTVWIGAVDALTGAARSALPADISDFYVPKTNTYLATSYAGISLTKSESADDSPDVVDAGTSGAPLIGSWCGTADDVARIMSSAYYRPDQLNVYFVATAGTPTSAGWTCTEFGGPNIIFIHAGLAGYHTLVHEVGHAFALMRPDWGHTDWVPGYYVDADHYPLNHMSQYAVAPDYFSVGQVVRMHADADSWLNVHGSAGSTIRTRQLLTIPPIVAYCGCPETVAVDDCARGTADIPRTATMWTTSVTGPMACYIKVASCLALPAGTATLDVAGFADAALTTPGSGEMRAFSLDRDRFEVTTSGSVVTVKRTAGGAGKVRVYVGGTYADVIVDSGC